MDSSKSESPRINKWSSDSPDTHLRSPFHERQILTNTNSPHHDAKEKENENNTKQESNNNNTSTNDENQDNNVPFHLSHHHLMDKQSSPQTQTTLASSASSTSSNNVRSPYRDMNRLRMIQNSNKYRSPNHQNMHHNMHSYSRSSVHDHLQRKLQKLEQDILSKNIQHDIMVNKEEMMAKRLKTKDIRIKNLQNDINKLRDQLTVKNETQEKLINELSEIQQQNRALNTKLRESNIGPDNNSNINDSYNESMRDILNHIRNDIGDIKQRNEQKEDAIIKQMNEMNNTNVLLNKMDEMNKNNENMMNNMHQSIKQNDIKMESMNSNVKSVTQNQPLLMNELKSMNNNTQSQQHVMNELKQEIKREIYSTKNDLNTEIEKIRNENTANIKQITNNLKYEINNALITKYDALKDNKNVNNDGIKQYKELIQSQSDIINENALKLQSLKQETKQMMQSIKQDITSSNHKLKQNSDENTNKTNNAILGLSPLFDKILNYFKKTDGNIVESIKENNNDLIQSFAQFKHDFQKIIESVVSQSPSMISSSPQKVTDSSSILVEMKRMNTYLNEFKSSERSEFNIISKNVQQMTRRHDEIVKIITNTLPISMDKIKKDNAKLSEMYNNLNQTMENINRKQSNISPTKHVYNNGGNEDSVKLIKTLIQSQIDEMKKNMTLKFDRLLQEINSRNVNMFNNIKQLNDNQQQHIINQSDSNQKKAIKNHESVLKNHLQQIQIRLNELNNTQNTINKRFAMNKNEDNNDNVVKEKLEYIIKDKDVIMKEVQLIKNLCNDIHKKSQQLPHFVARNKDLKMIQQSINTKEDINKENDNVISVLMIEFKIWCENILPQISNHRDNCSLYVIVYVLSQIAFATFCDNKKCEEDNDLYSIQTRAISMLDEIETQFNSNDDEINREIMIETLIEWIQSILTLNINEIWISRTKQEMIHFCHSQLKVNKAFVVIKNKMNQIIKKQSKTCLNISIFQPLILSGSCILLVLFCLWLQSIQTKQNNYF